MSPLYDLPRAVDRVRAAREAIDQSGGDVLPGYRAVSTVDLLMNAPFDE